MVDRPSILSVLGPIIAQYPPAEQRIFAALGERIAASRYRVWAEGAEDPSARAALEECAAREEDIATRVESLYSDAAEVQARIQRDHGDIRDQFFALLDSQPLADQFLMQAEAERAGGAAWRAFAKAADTEEEANALRSCAPLEEANAEALEQIVASMKQGT